MLYNLADEMGKQRFRAKALALLNSGSMVELRERKKRTLSQNSYLHLIIGVVAMETGNTLAYSKDIYFKRIANPALFIVTKKDPIAGDVQYLRSSADLSKEEMSQAIDRFKIWAAQNRIYLPAPGDESLLRTIEIEMARMEQYL